MAPLIASAMEVLPDIVGLVSSVVLANATHRVLVSRQMLQDSLVKVDGEIAALRQEINDPATRPEKLAELNEMLHQSQQARTEVINLDPSVGQFQSRDLREFKWGMLLLCLSFVLKLGFYFMKPTEPRGPGVPLAPGSPAALSAPSDPRSPVPLRGRSTATSQATGVQGQRSDSTARYAVQGQGIVLAPGKLLKGAKPAVAAAPAWAGEISKMPILPSGTPHTVE